MMYGRTVVIGLMLAGAAVALGGCARTPEQKAARFLQRGKTLVEKKDYSRAALELNNAYRLKRTGEICYQRGLAYLGLLDYNRAVLLFQEAVNLDANHNAARLKLAELMATSQKKEILEEVERMAQKALKLEPGSSEALRVRALAEMRLGDLEDAVSSLKQAVENSPADVNAAVTLAATKLAQRDGAGAEAVMRKLANDVNSAVAWTALAHFYRLIGKTKESDDAIRQGAQRNPNDAPALFDLALLHMRTGQAAEAETAFRKLAELPDARYRSAHAMYLYDTGKRDEAIREFESLVAKYTDDRPIRTQLAMAYLAAGRVPDAEKLLGNALRRNPKDVDALLLRARVRLGAGNLNGADADLSQLLGLQADSVEGHYWKAKVHFAAGRPKQFEQELGEALRLNPRRLDARLELARATRAAKRPDTALVLLDEMPKDQRGMLASVVERNWLLFDLRKDAELQGWLNKALEARRDPSLLLQRALLDMRRRKFADARSSLDEILRQNPEDVRAIDSMLALYVAEKRKPASLEWLRGRVAERPASAPLKHVLAQWLAECGDIAGARTTYQQAVAIDPKFKPAQLEIAKLDLAAGNLPLARAELTRLVESDQRDVPARLTLGALEEKAGDGAAALTHYQLVLAVDPQNVVALNNLAFVLAQYTNSLDEALSYASKAAEIAPESPAVHDTLGWVLYKKGVYQQAQQHLEAAVKSQPTALRKTHLGLTYHAIGKDTLARKAVDDALRLQPDSLDAQAALVEIARKR